jgi:hypothetical protein
MPHDSSRTPPKPVKIHVSKASDIPKEKHWAIVYSDTVYESGYHDGDPSTQKAITQYVAFFEQGPWEDEVKERTLRQGRPSEPAFVALVVEVPTITTTVKVEIK